MTLQGYLERIGYRGVPRVDVETLRELHRLHLLAIPYENLDVQLGRPVGLDIEPIYRKLVEQRRGGWCYEMNGLFSWALEEIGFPITRLSSGVMRAVRGDAALGNHLAIWVHLDEPMLADVGFGDGVLEPIAIVPGSFRQRWFDFSLEKLNGKWWRFHNHPAGGAPSFDFELAPGDRAQLARQCNYLQNSPESPFRQVAVVQRHVAVGLVILRGRVLKCLTREGVEQREIADVTDYTRTLQEVFSLEAPEPVALWENVERQHAAFVQSLARGRELDAGATSTR